MTDTLVTFFKALADSNRIKIVGLLAIEPLTVEQLAEMLSLRPSTVSHHLSQLSQAGLVSARAVSYYNVYQLETAVLEKTARQFLSTDELKLFVINEVDLDAYDRKVIRNFTDPEGHIKTFPAQRKKLEAILKYVLKDFQPGVRYTEKQVNEILVRYNEDTATLRRELVGYGYLKRTQGGSDYWKED